MKDLKEARYTCTALKRTALFLTAFLIFSLCHLRLSAREMDCDQFLKLFGLAFHMHRINYTDEQARIIFQTSLSNTLKELDPKGSIFEVAQAVSLVSNINIEDFKACNYQENITAIYAQKTGIYIRPSRVYEIAAKHFLFAMDPHSTFFDKGGWKKINDQLSGKDEGIGAVYRMNGKFPVILKVIPGGPSEQILIEGDIILEINGEAVENLSNSVIDLLLNSAHDSKLILKVQRKNKRLIFEISAAKYNVRSVDWRFLDKSGILHLVLREFSQESSKEVIAAIKEASSASDIRGLIFDLRFNPGGSLKEALTITSIFVPAEILATLVDKKGKQDISTDETVEVSLVDVPLILLLNQFSASASELAAQTLKDYKRGIIAGTDSFGKGTVQTVASPEWLSQVLSEDYEIAATVTTSQFYSPFGRSPQREGVSPHLRVVDNDLEEKIRAEREKAALQGKKIIISEKDYENALPQNNIASSVEGGEVPTNDIDFIVKSIQYELAYSKADLNWPPELEKDAQLKESYRFISGYTGLCTNFHMSSCAPRGRDIYASLP